MGSRARVCIVGVIIWALAPTSPIPLASAAPEDGAISSGPTVLSLSSVGLDATVAMYGLQGTQSLTIPVPSGLTPSELTARVELPVGVSGGMIAVTQDERTLSRVPLPTEFGAPVSLPLADADVVDNAISVMVRSYLFPLEGYCLYDPTLPLRLSDAAVSLTGTEATPNTVADFLPPVLRELELFIPPSPSPSESEAALQLATSVVAHYGTQNTAVTLAPVADGPVAPPQPASPLQRRIVIREGGEGGLSLQGDEAARSLLIGGPADELVDQSRALSGDIGRLALSSKAVAGPLRSAPELTPDNTTIRQLGQPGVNATALAPQVSIALDQTRLGRPSHNVRVRLQGAYTPLPSAVGGQLVASVAGEEIDRWSADGTGTIDRWVNLPDRVLQRYTNLDLAVDITGITGRCGEFQPITLTIDGDSPVQSTPAAPPLPSGFQALPQALMPKVHIGVDGSFDSIRRALSILVGLQRLSARPVESAVASLDEAITSPLPAILVNAAGWSDSRIALPVNAETNGTITVEDVDGTGQQGQLRLDPSVPFASVQTTYDGNRTVLIATSNDAPGELDALLGWLDSDVERWSRLTGDALIGAPGRAPVLVGTAAEQPQTVAQSKDLSVSWWGVGAVGIAAAVIAAISVIILHRRRSRAQP